ncbi:hypothetical protein [Jiangella endophytica]|uniref:hypothetical protein n=1 Tax=Jiangella endophytica TaxID=1623398 RepID=UPI00130021FF|nr:hypothetical protein [Jiangella endophytica]
MSRRTFVRGSLAAGGTGLLATTLPATAQAAELTAADPAGTVRVAADTATGTIRVLDAGGVHRLTITHLKYSNTARTFGASLVSQPSATELVIQYVTQHPGVTVTASIVAGLRKARIRWDVSGAEAVPDQFAIARAIVDGTETYRPVALWNRDAGGGIPYETTHGAGYAMTYADNRLLLRLRDSTEGFGDDTWLHAPGVAATGGGWVTEAVLVPGSMRPHAAGVIARDIVTPLGVELWTDQPFHVWPAGGAKTVRAEVVNAETTARQVRLAWTARTWDGAVQSGSAGPVSVAARSVWNPTFQVTLGGRDIAFVEAVVTDTADASVMAFSRTNLAVLSSHTYQAGETSGFGVSNYPWLLSGPGPDETAALMKLIGMTWVRTAYDGAPGIPPTDLDRHGLLHNVQLGGIPYGKTATDQRAWADAMVARCVTAGARYYECGNELNLIETERTPAEYVTAGLRPLRAAMAARPDATFKVMTCGLAGLDSVWLDGFGAAGGWSEVDVLAYHPGRGNYVADYSPPEPWLRPDGTRKPEFWNFIGSLRKADAARAADGGKELWLTEAYASTQPNRWWTDTYRHAAENVLLQLMFAKAHGVRCVTWYTLEDGIEQQPREADPGDIEYHFGLLVRDRSPKPSLLAFATAARFLDQADYLGRVTFSDPEVKGLLFTTPTGRFSVLWTRRDGYVLNNDPARRDPGNAAYYRTPEPWLDPWPTKTPVSLPTPAATTTVRELNSIGQETLHTAAGSRVTVTLDGAPRIFVGLDLTTTDTYPVN